MNGAVKIHEKNISEKKVCTPCFQLVRSNPSFCHIYIVALQKEPSFERYLTVVPVYYMFEIVIGFANISWKFMTILTLKYNNLPMSINNVINMCCRIVFLYLFTETEIFIGRRGMTTKCLNHYKLITFYIVCKIYLCILLDVKQLLVDTQVYWVNIRCTSLLRLRV